MPRFKDMLDNLQQKRDELKVKIHLGSMEARDEWSTLEKKWEKFAKDAVKELDEGSKAVGEELDALGDELAKGYEVIKKKLL